MRMMRWNDLHLVPGVAVEQRRRVAASAGGTVQHENQNEQSEREWVPAVVGLLHHDATILGAREGDSKNKNSP